MNVDSGTFQNLFTNAYQVAANAGSTQDVSITNSTFTNVNSWMVIQASGGSVTYSVQGDDGTTGVVSGSGAINLKTDNGGTLTGDVTSNLIGNGAVGSGAVCGGGCSGLINQRQGGSLTANIVGNTIRHVDSSAIFFSGGQDSGFGAGKMNVVITGNLIQDPDGAAPAQAIAGLSGIISGDANCVAANPGWDGRTGELSEHRRRCEEPHPRQLGPTSGEPRLGDLLLPRYRHRPLRDSGSRRQCDRVGHGTQRDHRRQRHQRFHLQRDCWHLSVRAWRRGDRAGRGVVADTFPSARVVEGGRRADGRGEWRGSGRCRCRLAGVRRQILAAAKS